MDSASPSTETLVTRNGFEYDPAFIPPVCSYGTAGQLAKLYAALAKAQGEFEPIIKNRAGKVEHRDKQTGVLLGTDELRYADLEEITAKTRPALSKHGLATIQPVSHAKSGGGLAIFTQLIHEDGGMLISELPVNKLESVRDMGALITYLRRYAKCALLDVSADDDLDQGGGEYAQAEPQEPRAGEVRRIQPDQPKVTPETQAFYTDDKFQQNLTGWIAAMNKGRTPEQIIKTATTRLQLTEAQIQTIHENAPKKDAE